MVACGMALAFHSGGHSRHYPGYCDYLLFDGLACAGAMAAEDERNWLISELQTELQAKKKIRDHTILQAFCDRRVLLLIAALFLALSGPSGEHLLDTHLREAPFGILGPGSDFTANNSSFDWHCRDAHERLALR